ncbi:lipid-A-disaccharide synthase [Helicobacter sp. MIT 21-1697]|uniref:lipid-A-disaccharide synthase n=1 Tax=Helicobacter sp. MIT 21-1697 TaxID=2993733 RepID=UPI00224AE360|nr:lipid-A-disaccharide synthase [Helicobacter sp. MIT 21-1697]MCX2716993.1 lipid-A-disaccharide synthase [Helicobacter sp. MIT 21-1697]
MQPQSAHSTPKRLFVSACEPSANLHLKFLAQNLDTSTHICGVFEKETFANFPYATPSYTLKDFAIMGFFDVIKKLAFFKQAIQNMSELAAQCDVVLLMDSSSFNLPIAKILKKNALKAPVIYYILPQVWAWKSWRAKEIEAVCDYLCAILPFELAMYPNAVAQNRAFYVGHPLLDEIPTLKEQPLPLENGKITFMPGSRKGEIRRIFPIFAAVAKELTNPKILVLPEHFKHLDKRTIHDIYGEDIQYFELSFDANTALLESSFAFVCSGTATLQATLIGTPLVLGYKTRTIDVMIARAFVRLKHIGLANILYNALHCGNPRLGEKEIHIELIQSQLTKENLLNAYSTTNPQVFFAKAQEIRNYLAYGSATKVARLLGENLTKRKPNA